VGYKGEVWRGLRGARELPLVVHGLRRTVIARWRNGNGNGNGHAVGVRILDGDPLAALEAELRRRFGEGNGNGNGHRELRPGRTYLVTGCAGFIGSHLVEALVERGCSVIGTDAFIDNYPRADKERNLAQCRGRGRVRFTELDLAEDRIEPLLDGVDGVFHLAARPGVRTSWGATFDTYLHDNLLATQRVFEAAVARRIRVVYASSSSVYGDAQAYPLREDARLVPVSPYGVTKLACEALANAYARSCGLDAVGLRYFSVYGPRQRPDMAFSRVLGCLADNRPFGLLGSGRQTRDFTYVGDVVEATLAAMEHGPSGRVYNIGGGSEISVLDSLTLCEQIVGRKLDLHQLPVATGDARRTIADVGRAWAELGWRPVTSLEGGLLAQARAFLGVSAERSLACAAQS
jgi:UDP-glucuronate 4-epimerase